MADCSPEKATNHERDDENLSSVSIPRNKEKESTVSKQSQDYGHNQNLDSLNLSLPKKPEASILVLKQELSTKPLNEPHKIQSRAQEPVVLNRDIFSRTLRWFADLLRKLDQSLFKKSKPGIALPPRQAQLKKKRKKGDGDEEVEASEATPSLFERPLETSDEQSEPQDHKEPELWREPPKKIHFDDSE